MGRGTYQVATEDLGYPGTCGYCFPPEQGGGKLMKLLGYEGTPEAF